MSTFPSTEQDESKICVNFEPTLNSSRKSSCEFVLDYDAMGNVIGIEIINLKLHAGPNSLGAIDRSLRSTLARMNYNYDDDSDCFYLQLAKDASIDQKAVDGVMTFNQEGEIIALSADAEEFKGNS